jgi:hypothetical protein
MKGFTCLNCGKSTYKGYGSDQKTLPCEICGDTRPAQMELSKFMKLRTSAEKRFEKEKKHDNNVRNVEVAT